MRRRPPSSTRTATLFPYTTRFRCRAYDNVGFTATLALKDVNLALAAGEALQVPLPSAMVCRDRLMSAVTHGNAEKDWSVMALEQARASGLGQHGDRSEEHTSELQSLMRISYAVFCLKQKTTKSNKTA